MAILTLHLEGSFYLQFAFRAKMTTMNQWPSSIIGRRSASWTIWIGVLAWWWKTINNNNNSSRYVRSVLLPLPRRVGNCSERTTIPSSSFPSVYRRPPGGRSSHHHCLNIHRPSRTGRWRIPIRQTHRSSSLLSSGWRRWIDGRHAREDGNRSHRRIETASRRGGGTPLTITTATSTRPDGSVLSRSSRRIGSRPARTTFHRWSSSSLDFCI